MHLRRFLVVSLHGFDRADLTASCLNAKPCLSYVLALAGLLLHGCTTDTANQPASASSSEQASVAEPGGAGSTSGLSHGGIPSKNIRLTDVTDGSGLAFVYHNDEEAGHFGLLETLGGGLAAIDFDRDGRDDLFCAGGGQYSADGARVLGRDNGLFRCHSNWSYVDVTQASGVAAQQYYSHGVFRWDYDNDGFGDILITGFGGLSLYVNQGDGTFVERSHAAGLTNAQWSCGAGWGDVNEDGWLDMYVANYVDWSPSHNLECPGPQPETRDVCPPRMYTGLDDVLYVSNGDGTFHDITGQGGVRGLGKGLGVIVADLDLDNDLDIYVANDTDANFLYRNQGLGQLEEIGDSHGAANALGGESNASMGVDLVDVNSDGLPDVWVVNYEMESPALYQNMGNLMFEHRSAATRLDAIRGMYVSWGTACPDLDHDGDEDIFVSNGHVVRYAHRAPRLQRPLLYENIGQGQFEILISGVGAYMDATHMGRGVAAGDYDTDGDVDFAISHTNEPVALLRNDLDPNGQWLAVNPIGTRSPRDPVGLVARLETASGTQVRHFKGGGSYASTHERQLHFGIAPNVPVHKLTLTWPTGTEQVVENPTLNQLLTIIEP